MINRLAMAASVLTRMGSALVAFVIVARALGPSTYGLLATVFAYATLMSLLTDFGFTSKSLRDIAAAPERGGAILNASLSLKLSLTLAAMAAGCVAIWLVPLPRGTGVASLMLGSSVLIGAIGDLALTAYRAKGRYVEEAVFTIVTAAAHLLIVGAVALLNGQLLWIGLAFVSSRAIYTVLAVMGAARLFDGWRFKPERLRVQAMNVRRSWTWALDSGLSYLTGQLDGLVVPIVLGVYDAGIYQSGARFAQSAIAMVAVLASIHIPKLAAQSASGREFSRVVDVRMTAEYALFGGALGCALLALGPSIQHYILGPSFTAVNSIWLGLGVFILTRYMAAAIGTRLVAFDYPLERVVCQVVGLAVCVLGLALVAPARGLASVPWIMSAGALVTLVAYLIVAHNRWRKSSSHI